MVSKECIGNATRSLLGPNLLPDSRQRFDRAWLIGADLERLCVKAPGFCGAPRHRPPTGERSG